MIEAIDVDLNELCDGGGDDIAAAIESQRREIYREDDGQEADDQPDDAASSSAKDDKPKTVKRIIKNPRPKLNPERLCGERGIAILPKIFSEVKLKGKGHETEDLKIVMKTLEHWAHRLFPLFPFDDTLGRIEKLGSKREVQTCLKKIRLDMPVLSSDFVNDNEDDDDDEDDAEKPPEIDSQLHATLFSSTADKTAPTPDLNSAPQTSEEQRLTDEQKERMERSRLLAVERRKARMQSLASNDSWPRKESEQVPDVERDVTIEQRQCAHAQSLENTTFESETLAVLERDKSDITEDLVLEDDILAALEAEKSGISVERMDSSAD